MKRKISVKMLAWLLAGLMMLPSTASAAVTENPAADILALDTGESTTEESTTEESTTEESTTEESTAGESAAGEPDLSDGLPAEEAGSLEAGALPADSETSQVTEGEITAVLGSGEYSDILAADEEAPAEQSSLWLYSSTGTGSYYNQLSTQEQGYYQVLEQNNLLNYPENGSGSLVFSLGTGFTFTNMSYNELMDYCSKTQYKADFATAARAIGRAFDAYVKDHPEVFWAAGFTYSGLLTKQNVPVTQVQAMTIQIGVKFTLYYPGVLDDVAAVQSGLQTAKNTVRTRINGSTERYTIAKVIHDYITGLMSYAPNLSAQNDYGYWHTLSGPLLAKYKNQGVCEGYAKLFKYLCDEFGVPCMIAVGSAYSGESVNHMWNYVRMENNSWYLVDVTWDDGTTPTWNYFLKKQPIGSHISHGIFSSSGSGISYTAFTYPALSASDYSVVPLASLKRITLSSSTASISLGRTRTLSVVSYLPARPTGPTITWTTSNSKVATVSSGGVVTAVAPGTAVITAAVGSVKAACTVTVAIGNRILIEDFVTRLYKLVLGRNPDSGGLAYWSDLLEDQARTGGEVASGFFFSTEYQNKKAGDSSFVETLYLTLMNRPSDASGKAYWVNYLSTGVTRAYIFAGFVNSTEFTNICNQYKITRGTYKSTEIADQNVNVTAFVSRMYTVCLGRSFDRAGLNDWVNRLLKGDITGKGITYGFFLSTEFKNKNTPNERFVTLAYQTLFNRNPDTSGYNDWLSSLRDGHIREAVLNGFIGSAEFTKLCRSYGIRKE